MATAALEEAPSKPETVRVYLVHARHTLIMSKEEFSALCAPSGAWHGYKIHVTPFWLFTPVQEAYVHDKDDTTAILHQGRPVFREYGPGSWFSSSPRCFSPDCPTVFAAWRVGRADAPWLLDGPLQPHYHAASLKAEFRWQYRSVGGLISSLQLRLPKLIPLKAAGLSLQIGVFKSDPGPEALAQLETPEHTERRLLARHECAEGASPVRAGCSSDIRMYGFGESGWDKRAARWLLDRIRTAVYWACNDSFNNARAMEMMLKDMARMPWDGVAPTAKAENQSPDLRHTEPDSDA